MDKPILQPAERLLRYRAVSAAYVMIKAGEDYQKVVSTIRNDALFAPLFAGKTDDESYEYGYAIIRSAETLLRIT